jgi:hypothetical protein
MKIILISTIFLAILGFFICNAYYVSEQKTKQVNICSLFEREYITRISQVQKLQNSKGKYWNVDMYALYICICICMHAYVCVYMHICMCVDVGAYL